MSTDNWRPKRRKKRPQESQSSFYRMYNIALSFGLTLAISLFLMINLGQWLDQRFGTNIIFTVICLMLAIISGFRYLYHQVLRMEEADKKKRMNKS